MAQLRYSLLSMSSWADHHQWLFEAKQAVSCFCTIMYIYTGTIIRKNIFTNASSASPNQHDIPTIPILSYMQVNYPYIPLEFLFTCLIIIDMGFYHFSYQVALLYTF